MSDFPWFVEELLVQTIEQITPGLVPEIGVQELIDHPSKLNKIFKTPLANLPSAPGTCNQACTRCGEGLAGWTPPLCLDCEEFEDSYDGERPPEWDEILPAPVVGWDANGSPVTE